MPLSERLEELEAAFQALSREFEGLRASHADVLDPLLTVAVPATLRRLLIELQDAGWRCSYRRGSGHRECGIISLEHPTDAAHDCSLPMPLPEDPTERELIASKIRARAGLRWAA